MANVEPESEKQGIRDVATALPIVAIFLVAPPIIHIFAKPVLVAGLPLIVVYVFSWWAAVVAAAFLVAGRLKSSDAVHAPTEPKGGVD